MECQGNTTDYFDFKCFKVLYEKFHSNLSTSGEEYMKEYPEYINDELNLVPTYKKLFVSLTSYLAQDHLFLQHTTPVCCNYINYWLHDEIKSKHSIYPESIFEFFKKYTDGYAKKRFRNPSYKNNTCSPYYKPLFDKNFDKMRILYRMYELYVQNITTKKYYDNKTKCDNFKLIEFNYNELRNRDPADYELHKKLKDFKNLVVNHPDPQKLQCDFHISKLMSQPIVSLPQEDDSHTKEQTLELPVPSSIVSSQGKDLQESDTPNVAQEKAELETRDAQEQADPETHSQEPTPGSIKIHDPQRQMLQHQLGGQDYRLTLLHRQGNLDFPTRNLEQIRHVSNVQDAIPGETEGVVDSIKGTFNSIVENIQPAPILGVSGGMGALFLILKYTPVGTIFRGRGNRRLIPGSFVGEYPGFMPNFQGYEYWNIPNDQFNIAYARE